VNASSAEKPERYESRAIAEKRELFDPIEWSEWVLALPFEGQCSYRATDTSEMIQRIIL
jgi:hypothetical protein